MYFAISRGSRLLNYIISSRRPECARVAPAQKANRNYGMTMFELEAIGIYTV